MAGFNMKETITRTPQEVFAFITNPENASKVMESVTESVVLTEGPLGVGTRFRETRMMNGKEAVAELEVVGFEPGQRYAVRNVTEGITSTYTYTFSPADGGTAIDLECEVTAGGLKKLMVPVVASILKKEDGDHLQQLKAAMEA